MGHYAGADATRTRAGDGNPINAINAASQQSPAEISITVRNPSENASDT
jgi:hypothetical protein